MVTEVAAAPSLTHTGPSGTLFSLGHFSHCCNKHLKEGDLFRVQFDSEVPTAERGGWGSGEGSGHAASASGSRGEGRAQLLLALLFLLEASPRNGATNT